MSNQLDAPSMILAAERATGLGDWGGDLFSHPFSVLIEDLNHHAQLNDLGKARAYRRLMDSLESRLRLVEDRKRFPGVADEKIEAPIIVAGLPRAGSTFFHNLLSADPVNRSPMTWEIFYPSPPPDPASYASDPRIDRCAEALDFEGFTSPDLQKIHPFDARRPEECNFMWELSFLTVNYMAFWNVPNYTRLLFETDMTPVYEEERKLLQHLQSRMKGERWVLKTPAHNLWIDTLFKVFPDARIVLCHRDPAKVLASLSNNLAVNRSLFSDVVPGGSFGMLDMQARGMRNVAAKRAEPGMAAQFFDAHFVEVQADPLAVLRRCYDQFGVAISDDRMAAIGDWMEADRKAHALGGTHSYEMESFGLDYEQVDAVMGDYIRDFGVALEREGFQP
ncbi:MAG: sulfotransferase [Novosphingobium sp.]